MNFNKHYDLVGEHAFLSPSKFHWINYDEDKISSAYSKYLAVQKGTALHAFAHQCILLGIKLPKTKNSLNQFVNDAIGYRMHSEQPLFYSVNAFGTADAISFRDKILRIHDLKTGVSVASMGQLLIYASFFCLEYDQKPKDIEIELRIYQLNEVTIYKPDPRDILEIMDKVVSFDKKIEKIKQDMEE
jgi:hypothetical protein